MKSLLQYVSGHPNILRQEAIAAMSRQHNTSDSAVRSLLCRAVARKWIRATGEGHDVRLALCPEARVLIGRSKPSAPLPPMELSVATRRPALEPGGYYIPESISSFRPGAEDFMELPSLLNGARVERYGFRAAA